MTDVNQDLEQEEPAAPSELDSLKARADLIGLKYHPSIGVDSLREKLAKALSDEPDAEEDAPAAPETKVAQDAAVPQVSARKKARDEASRQIRVRVTCMNPLKKEWEGEIFSVGNGQIGSFKKFVPFNLDEGYHIPHIIYTEMKERKFQTFVTEKAPNGQKVRTGKLIREFGIEVLDPLTPTELKDLAQRQAMANGTGQ